MVRSDREDSVPQDRSSVRRSSVSPAAALTRPGASQHDPLYPLCRSAARVGHWPRAVESAGLRERRRRSTPRLSAFPPARLCGRFYCAEELLIIRYRRDYPFAIRLLLGHSNTVEFRTREKSSYQKTLILPIQCRTKNPEFHSQNSAPSCTNIWSTFFG